MITKSRLISSLAALGCVTIMLYAWLVSQPLSVDDYHGHSGNQEKVTIQPIDVLLDGIPVNIADAQQLTALPGIGETYAHAIIEEREANGFFHYPQDLIAVKGIGIKRLNAIRELISMVTPDPNGN